MRLNGSQSILLLAFAGVVLSCVAVWYHQYFSTSNSQLIHRSMVSGAPRQFDVVIVGSGLAGLSAALEVANAKPGAKILLLDKEPKTGGNSAKASSGINALVSVEDTTFEDDSIRSAGNLAQPDLIHTLVEGSKDSISFLTSFGVQLTQVSQLGGHTFPRTHRNSVGPNVGFAITKALSDALAKVESVTVLTSSKVTSLLFQPDVGVTGVEYIQGQETAQAHAKSVILATGGFAANSSLLEQYAPQTAKLPITNGHWATGDGIFLAESIGADLVDMGEVQIHPTGFINRKDPTAHTKFLAPEALRGSGAIMVDDSGRRFVNELDTRDKVSAAVMALPHQRCYLLLSQEGATKFGGAIKFYVGQGLMASGSLLDAARFISDSNSKSIADTLLQELRQYSSDSAQGRDGFHKTVFPTQFSLNDEDPLFIAEVAPVVHYTMGGLRMSKQAEILDKNGRAIPHLYGAGEATGGVHGHNRLGGNSLCECVVFGRIAGRQAALAI